MADDRETQTHTGPDDGLTCDQVRASIDLFVLDALEPAETALIEDHLTTCAGCRAERARAESTVATLVLMAPPVAVPDGFVDRVVARAPTAPTQPQQPPQPMVAPVVPLRAPRRGASRVLAVAAAVILVALVVTAIGAALGTVLSSRDQVAGPPSTAIDGGRTAALVSVDGQAVGSVAVDDTTDPARPALLMAVDQVQAGVRYDCVIRTEAGELVTVGSWTPAAEGPASWAVTLDPAVGRASEVLLVSPSGTTLATARLS